MIGINSTSIRAAIVGLLCSKLTLPSIIKLFVGENFQLQKRLVCLTNSEGDVKSMYLIYYLYWLTKSDIINVWTREKLVITISYYLAVGQKHNQRTTYSSWILPDRICKLSAICKHVLLLDCVELVKRITLQEYTCFCYQFSIGCIRFFFSPTYYNLTSVLTSTFDELRLLQEN